MTNPVAHVVCNNDSIELVVVGTYEEAVAAMSKARAEYEQRYLRVTGDYGPRPYFHIHTVPLLATGSEPTAEPVAG